MKIAKWSNSLVVRLAAGLVRDLGLKEGGRIDLVKDDSAVKMRRQPRAEEVLESLRRFQGSRPLGRERVDAGRKPART